MSKIPIKLKTMPVARVEIINLIDVLITLIAFFMLTAVFANNQRQIPIKLPSATHSEVLNPSEKIHLEMTKEQTLFFEGNSIRRNDLRELLKNYSGETVVIIKADKECKYQWIIEIMDELKKTGLKKISFEVTQK